MNMAASVTYRPDMIIILWYPGCHFRSTGTTVFHIHPLFSPFPGPLSLSLQGLPP
jgi:hypothetical protein